MINSVSSTSYSNDGLLTTDALAPSTPGDLRAVPSYVPRALTQRGLRTVAAPCAVVDAPDSAAGCAADGSAWLPSCAPRRTAPAPRAWRRAPPSSPCAGHAPQPGTAEALMPPRSRPSIAVAARIRLAPSQGRDLLRPGGR